ncbi:MAG TPA: TetR/AcrR family transcriptional regulator [Rhizomicrobium sp.]|nr:TetR/AcrR family transcriptional regulator [Rhizomicrobium sp.]
MVERTGKSARTQARLIDAAVAIFARDGFEAASVNEIAREAGVVNGTFYVYFRDKDDIAAAVALRIAEDLTRRLDEAMTGIDDAAERIATATRRFIELAAARPEWGRALFRAVWLFPDLRGGVVARLRADLMRGRRQGAFTIAIDDVLVDMFASMMAAALFARLQGKARVGSKVAELQLRMLGVSAPRARRIARLRLAPLPMEADRPAPP